MFSFHFLLCSMSIYSIINKLMQELINLVDDDHEEKEGDQSYNL